MHRMLTLTPPFFYFLSSLQITAGFFSLNAWIIPPAKNTLPLEIIMELKTRYVIITGFILAALVILGLTWPLLTLPSSRPPTESICISPTVHPDGLTRYWDTLAADLGIDAGSAALEGMRLSIYPDDSVERINLQFYAMKEGVDRHYSVYYYNSTHHCGHFSSESYAENRLASEAQYPQDPREFLSDIEQINTTDLGLDGQTLFVTTDNTWTNDSRMFTPDRDNCRELYLLQNGSLQRMDRISTSNSPAPLYPREFMIENCISYESGTMSCSFGQQVTIIPDTRLRAATMIRNTTVPGPGPGKCCPPENRTECTEKKFCLVPWMFCYTLSSECTTYSSQSTRAIQVSVTTEPAE